MLAGTPIKKLVLPLFLLLQLGHLTSAQRPSYAGPRPNGGLNQKDKYHQTSVQASSSSTVGAGVGVTSRFGGTASSESPNAVPFGVAQRPPIGWEVVQPHAQFIPLPLANSGSTPQFTVDNRIGGTDGYTIPAQFQPLPPLAPVGGLPLDAHGDQALIDYLNTVPVDQRPFWFLNYQAIEAQRNSTRPAFAGAVGSRGSFLGK